MPFQPSTPPESPINRVLPSPDPLSPLSRPGGVSGPLPPSWRIQPWPREASRKPKKAQEGPETSSLDPSSILIPVVAVAAVVVAGRGGAGRGGAGRPGRSPRRGRGGAGRREGDDDDEDDVGDTDDGGDDGDDDGDDGGEDEAEAKQHDKEDDEDDVGGTRRRRWRGEELERMRAWREDEVDWVLGRGATWWGSVAQLATMAMVATVVATVANDDDGLWVGEGGTMDDAIMG